MTVKLEELGKRLRAYRLDHGLSPEEVAERLGVSRAAVYRIENGDISKLDTVSRLARLFGCSFSSALGMGMEYYPDAKGYFERMRQIEAESDQVVACFPPFSYLLSSDEYSFHLRATLMESIPAEDRDSEIQNREMEEIIEILLERKKAQKERRFSVISFISAPEIERWLKLGNVGRFDLPDDEVEKWRLMARREVEHLVSLVKREPMGVQIALIDAPLPNVAFQLYRAPGRTMLGLSPFRLGGELPNIKTGMAMLTADEEPVQFYEKFVEGLWRKAHKGRDAVVRLQEALQRSGVVVG